MIHSRSSYIPYNNSPEGITSKDSCNVINYNKIQPQLYRVFNNSSFKEGGRFYGAQYQRLNSTERSRIMINGNPTIEIDYSSLHPNMLYHINNIDYQGDPYSFYGENIVLRSAVKLLFNIALNSKSKISGVRAYIKKLSDRSSMTKRTLAMNAIKNEMSNHNLKAYTLYDSIIEHHPIMKNYLGKNFGVKLQNKDSLIASDILIYFKDKGIPCLCIHDSFIVEEQHKDELNEVMHNVYKNHMNGFECKTTVNGAIG